jgi:hypothetical protein
MLRTNLSTRPFYNERAVHVVLGLVALVVLALTVVNVVEVVRLSRDNTVLSSSMRDDRTAASDLTRKAREARQGINQDELKLIVGAAREANTLIDGPTIDEGGTNITLSAVGRRPADLDEFIEKLEATGAFENVLARQRNLIDDGMTQATIEGLYVPEASPTEAVAPSAAPAKSSTSAGGAQ